MGGSTRGGASRSNRRRRCLIWRRGTSRSRRCGRWLDEDRRPFRGSVDCVRASCSWRVRQRRRWSSPGPPSASSRPSQIGATPRGASNCSCRGLMCSTRHAAQDGGRGLSGGLGRRGEPRATMSARGALLRAGAGPIRAERAPGVVAGARGGLWWRRAPTSARPPSTVGGRVPGARRRRRAGVQADPAGRTRCGSSGRTCTAPAVGSLVLREFITRPPAEHTRRCGWGVRRPRRRY